MNIFRAELGLMQALAPLLRLQKTRRSKRLMQEQPMPMHCRIRPKAGASKPPGHRGAVHGGEGQDVIHKEAEKSYRMRRQAP